MDKNKLTIILTAFSPNYNHIASVRISKIAKYLSFHHKVIILAGLPDYSLNNNANTDIGNATLIEITGVAKNKSNTLGRQQEKRSVAQKIKIFLGPLIMFFFAFSSGGGIFYKKREFKEKLHKIISENQDKKINILTSYNPWSIIKLGYLFKSKYDINWIIDYRDLPFQNIVEPITFLPIFKRYVKKITKISDKTICVTNEIKNKINKFDPGKAIFYPNGYDEDDFKEINVLKAQESNNEYVSVRYAGRFYPDAYRSLEPFVRMLKNLEAQQIEVLFEYAGPQESYVVELFKKYKIEEKLICHGLLSRSESLKFQASSDILLSISYTGKDQNKGDGIITGKIFEYIKSNKPIINICTPNWELSSLIKSSLSNLCITIDEEDKFNEFIINRKYLMPVEYNRELLNKFDHCYLVDKIREI